MKLETSPLPDSLYSPLQEWLRQPEFETLLTVLRSKALALEYEAMKSRADGEGANDKFELKARSEAFRADQIHATIKLLTELKAITTPPPTYIIKPQ